ncbi:MAG: phosphoribosylanthranilate isomerase [Clostridiales bacterium]|nr:phosphoribosylanthranilate isomerase [Clostridiales bacterium]
MMQVKICGLSRLVDIDIVNEERPDYCGFIINYPKSKRSLSPKDLSPLLARLGSHISPVGVFVDQPLDLVAGILNRTKIAVAQLHGKEDNEYISRLRLKTSKPIWQAFEVTGIEDIDRAVNSQADLVLLDAGKGAGLAFDWTLLEGFPRPFALAGGLRLDKLERALRTGASLLDVSSGVESGGKKDPEKVKSFVNLVRSRG